MKVLLALSGGLDSTYLLYYLSLKEGFDIETVVFMHENLTGLCPDDEIYYGRDMRETSWHSAELATPILKWFADHKTPIKSHYVRNCILPKEYEAPTSVWIKSCTDLMKDKDMFITGRTLDKFSFDETKRLEELNELSLQKTGKPTTFPLIQRRITRISALMKMPQELINLTLSCQWPTRKHGKLVGCGKCEKCKDNEKYTALVQHNNASEEELTAKYLNECSARKVPTSPGQSTSKKRRKVYFD